MLDAWPAWAASPFCVSPSPIACCSCLTRVLGLDQSPNNVAALVEFPALLAYQTRAKEVAEPIAATVGVLRLVGLVESSSDGEAVTIFV